MKKLLLITITFCWLTAGSVRAEYPLGVSLGMVKVPEPEKTRADQSRGHRPRGGCLQLFLAQRSRERMLHRAYRVKGAARRSRTESLVLPPAVQPPARHLGARSAAARRKRPADGADDPPRVDLRPAAARAHPSSEPIADEERRSACRTRPTPSVASSRWPPKGCGAVLCVENLPPHAWAATRASLCIADYPEVMVCFDSNHLSLKEAGACALLRERGQPHRHDPRLVDYDRRDERHWLPGEGVTHLA